MQEFRKAEKIWLKGLSGALNIQAGFLCELPCWQNMNLSITGSTLYRVFWNGELLHYGPARGPHGYCRIDRVIIPALSSSKSARAVLAIEVAGYNCESYYTLRYPSFLQAEVECEENVVASTGAGDFKALRLHSRHQKVLRYSYQRTFTEVYSLTQEEARAPWYIRLPERSDATETLKYDIGYLERDVSLPSLKSRGESSLVESGHFVLDPDKAIAKSDYPSFISLDYDGIALTGFPVEQLSMALHETVSSMVREDVTEKKNRLVSGEYSLIEFPLNNTGFIDFSVTALKDSLVILIFDEKLIGGRIKRNCRPTSNFIALDLQSSDEAYHFTSFEVYGFKYLEVALVRGEISFSPPRLIEYGTADWDNSRLKVGDRDLELIFDAARQTYRQNTLDVFMDCPTRERAGWLCDSYFTGKAAQLFSGRNDVEKAMLENYILRSPDPNIPREVPVMCYPADHINKRFIPQWAMWYIAELEGYFQRDGSADMGKFKKISLDFISWCRSYENEFGLLEDLPSWNFVEWSKANEWTDGVNYPSNMLYSRILKLAGKWYGRADFLTKAEIIDNHIIENSWNGEFFIDHSVRDGEGSLVPTSHISEVCQYSAYAHGLIRPEDPRFDSLWDKIINLFGPTRKAEGIRPDVAYANAFIGNFLRAEILLENGNYGQVLKEIKGYYLKMAKITGTLWEHDDITSGSLNHGFASYIGLAIVRCLAGVQYIDNRKKEVYLDFDFSLSAETDLEWGTPWGPITVNRQTGSKGTIVSIRFPEKFKIVDGERMKRYSFEQQADGRGFIERQYFAE